MKQMTLGFISALLLAFSCSSGSATSLENTGEKDAERTNKAAAEAVSPRDGLTGTQGETAGKPVHLTKEDFLSKVMNYEQNQTEWVYEGDLPAVIDFYADWCGPCRMAAPVLEELAKEYEDQVHIYKVDTEKEKELAAVFGIRSIPAFLFVPSEGTPTMTSGIGPSQEETKVMFRKLIDEILLGKTPEKKL